jgi:hypothetical protein
VELLNERSTVEAGEEGDEVFDWRAELKLMEEENKKNQVTPPPPRLKHSTKAFLWR